MKAIGIGSAYQKTGDGYGSFSSYHEKLSQGSFASGRLNRGIGGDSYGSSGSDWNKIRQMLTIRVGTTFPLRSVDEEFRFPASFGSQAGNEEHQEVSISRAGNNIQVRVHSPASPEPIAIINLTRVGTDELRFDNPNSETFVAQGWDLATIGVAVWIALISNRIIAYKVLNRGRQAAGNAILAPRRRHLGNESADNITDVGPLAEPHSLTGPLNERPEPKGDMNTGVPGNSPKRTLWKGPCPPGKSDRTAGSREIQHDLACSKPADNVMFFGICGLKGNFSECCIEHDIELWCVPSMNAAAALLYCKALSLKLGACVFGKCMEAIANTDKGFWCNLGNAFLGTAGAIILSALFTTVTGQMCSALLLMPHRFPSATGQNRDSCLCGGTTPTTSSDGCRNLCTERNLPQDCFKCRWECDYNDKGQPISRRFITPRDGEKGCCPGSGRQCTHDCDETKVDKCPPQSLT